MCVGRGEGGGGSSACVCVLGGAVVRMHVCIHVCVGRGVNC